MKGNSYIYQRKTILGPGIEDDPFQSNCFAYKKKYIIVGAIFWNGANQ